MVDAPPSAGGSPRGRGRHAQVPQGRIAVGWIPAGAGETAIGNVISKASKVDPRGGGGDNVINLGDAAKSGGSPRGRGRQAILAACARRYGWIPAGAGETQLVEHLVYTERVDPRGGGGDAARGPHRLDQAGGSPRGRGRRDAAISRAKLFGWIPAGAGETWASSTSASRWRVDPRGGGGDTNGTPGAVPVKGGSPRGRGRQAGELILADDIGWIPAGAGETGTTPRS